MKFKNFLLNESISKIEFDEILNNNQIIAGAEFEFYFNWAEEFSEFYDKAINSYENYRWNLIKYNDEKDSLENEIEEQEKNINNLNGELKSIKKDSDEFKILQKDLRNAEFYLNDLKNKNDIIFKKIKDLEYPEDYTTYVEMFNDGIYRDPREIDPSIESTLKWQIDRVKNKFPFKNYRLLESPQIGDDFWGIVPDISLDMKGFYGIEIISPPLTLKDLLIKCEEMFSFIKKYGYTTDKCGFHIHMSIPEKKKNFDPLKLMLFAEEGYVYNKFLERVGNDQTKSIEKILYGGQILPGDLKEIFKKIDDKEISITTQKFTGINLVDVRNAHVEFRYMGGKNYETSFEKIKKTIINYGYWMSIACDSTFKKKEYLLKLERFSTKMEELLTVAKIYMTREFIRELKINYSKSASKDINKLVDDLFALEKKYITTLRVKDFYEQKIKNIQEIPNYFHLIKNVFIDDILNFITKPITNKVFSIVKSFKMWTQ